MDNWYTYELRSGDEPFVDGDKQLDFTVRDFWSYCFSNLAYITGHVAEFIVENALGIEIPTNKIKWEEYDIDYRGVRIEVKQTGYTHTWTAYQSKIRRFGIQKVAGERNNDIYIFCLFGEYGEKPEEANPIDVSRWKFYVVPTKRINEECGDQASISLGRIFGLGYEALSFGQIKEEVDRVIDAMK